MILLLGKVIPYTQLLGVALTTIVSLERSIYMNKSNYYLFLLVLVSITLIGCSSKSVSITDVFDDNVYSYDSSPLLDFRDVGIEYSIYVALSENDSSLEYYYWYNSIDFDEFAFKFYCIEEDSSLTVIDGYELTGKGHHMGKVQTDSCTTTIRITGGDGFTEMIYIFGEIDISLTLEEYNNLDSVIVIKED